MRKNLNVWNPCRYSRKKIGGGGAGEVLTGTKEIEYKERPHEDDRARLLRLSSSGSWPEDFKDQDGEYSYSVRRCLLKLMFPLAFSSLPFLSPVSAKLSVKSTLQRCLVPTVFRENNGRGGGCWNVKMTKDRQKSNKEVTLETNHKYSAQARK